MHLRRAPAFIFAALLLLLALRGPAESAGAQTPPVSIEVCGGAVQSATNPNLKVGVGFRNLTDVEAKHVEFDILLMDSSDNVVDTRSVSIDGTFAPNVLIAPRRAAVSDALLTQPEYPDSPAWNVANHFGSGVVRVRCELHAAKFADGTSWNRAVRQ